MGVDLRLLPGVHGASIDVVRFYTGACRMPEGRSTGEYIEGITSGIRREPVGVWGQITPWNYPFMMAVWKWAPAVAAGNTVVLKPSELTPSSTFRMAELLTDVLPAGVVNVVCGGPDAGSALAAHRDGFFLSPTVVAGLRQHDELLQSEIFGSVITVQSYGGDDEAIAMANGVDQRLTASVWTDSHARAMRFLRDLDFGCGVGERPRTDGLGAAARRVRLVGVRQDLGSYGLDDYTRIKHVAHAL